MYESQSKFNSTLFRQTNNHDKSAQDFIGHKSGNSSLIRDLECVRLIVVRNKNAKKSCYAMNLLYRDFWNTLGFILSILIPEYSQLKTPLVLSSVPRGLPLLQYARASRRVPYFTSAPMQASAYESKISLDPKHDHVKARLTWGFKKTASSRFKWTANFFLKILQTVLGSKIYENDYAVDYTELYN